MNDTVPFENPTAEADAPFFDAGAEPGPASIDPPPADGMPFLDQLPVRLTAEIGTLRSTVGELQGLVPGTLLALDGRVPGEVTLRADSGAVLARGELVDIDGQLGVQITRVGA